MAYFQRSFWQKLRSSLAELRKKPRLGDIFSELTESRRRYHRHVLESSDGANLMIEGLSFRVIDLSYGGLRLAVEDASDFKQRFSREQPLLGLLSIVGTRYEFKLRLISAGDSGASLSFDELTKVDEVFLSNILYFMDVGILLKGIPKHSVSNYYRRPEWLSYGGLKGGMEVHLHLDDDGQVAEAHIFYMQGFRQDYALFSARGVAVTSRPARELSARDKRLILTRVLCVLIGLRQIGKTRRLDGIIAKGLHKLVAPKKEPKPETLAQDLPPTSKIAP